MSLMSKGEVVCQEQVVENYLKRLGIELRVHENVSCAQISGALNARDAELRRLRQAPVLSRKRRGLIDDHLHGIELVNIELQKLACDRKLLAECR